MARKYSRGVFPGCRIASKTQFPGGCQLVKHQIDHGCGEQREQLGQQQSADQRDTQRLAQFRAHAAADDQRNRAEYRGESGHQDGPQPQLEREDFPKTNWFIWRWFWRPRLALRGFFNMEFFRHVVILHGCAVGGGSITYANTMVVPPDLPWRNGSWAGLADWKAEMPAHFQTAMRMLGVIENRILGPADHFLKRAAEAAGVGHTFYRTKVAAFQAARRNTRQDLS